MKQLILISFFIFSFLLSGAQTKGELSVSVTTSSTGGKYAPDNIIAIWVEDSSGKFVKTLLANADKRKTHLNNWETSTSNVGKAFNKTDAITGATNSSHKTRTCKWDATNYNGEVVADGSYSLCMELTDKNNTGNYSTFDFTKGTENIKINPENKPSFSSIEINWTAEIQSAINKQDIEEYQFTSNPGSGIFNILGDNIKMVLIYNAKGKLVYKGGQNNINILNQSSGLYIIEIKTNNKTITKKVIKH